jgi:hypothetical protein
LLPGKLPRNYETLKRHNVLKSIRAIARCFDLAANLMSGKSILKSRVFFLAAAVKN